jgi:predicted dehydrogenase
MATPRIVITGIGGYGRVHLENARRLEAEGALTIAATVDPAVPEAYDTLDEALALGGIDVVVVATPLHTHSALAEQAMLAGADVLLEKPPVPTLAEFEHLLAVEARTGRAVQVGFQSLGSAAVAALRADALGLGPVEHVAAHGLWSRDLSYWARARWAGRRTLDGRPVVDGVATNPLAHSIATALRIAGYDDAAAVTGIEIDAYRVNDIEADDTTSLRITGAGLPTVTAALTLCAPPELVRADDRAAVVTVRGGAASASLSYTTDVVTLGGEQRAFDRADLLENLLAHRRGDAELIVPLRSTGTFMRVVEAMRLAADATPIGPEHVTWQGEGQTRHPLLDGIAPTVLDCAERGLLFRESGAPWAQA